MLARRLIAVLVLCCLGSFLDLCGFQPVLFSLTVCLTIQDKTNRPVFTHLLQHLKRLDAHGLKSLPEGEEVDGGDGSGSLGAGIGPGIQLTQGGHARRMQPQTRLETKTAVLQVVEQVCRAVREACVLQGSCLTVGGVYGLRFGCTACLAVLCIRTGGVFHAASAAGCGLAPAQHPEPAAPLR